MPDAGAWDDEALLATVVSYDGVGDDESQPLDVRFLRAVSRLARERSGVNPNPSSTLTVFLMHSQVPADLDAASLVRQYMLDNPNTEFEGHLWLATPLVQAGAGLSLAGKTETEIFHFVTAQLGLGVVPAVIYDSRSSPFQVLHFPAGLGSPLNRQVRPAGFVPITLDEIFAEIDRVHERKMATPNANSAALKLWLNKEKGYPSEYAELTIQAYLENFFMGAFPRCRIDTEIPEVSGRLDIEIVESDPVNYGSWISHAIIELKVLKSFTSGGTKVYKPETERWIDEGVDQAYNYRVDHKSRASALCCFDMRLVRDGEKCFAHVRAKALANDVALRVWPIYSDLKEFRKDRANTSASKRITPTAPGRRRRTGQT